MAVGSIIFDLDGTLIDSSAGVVEAVNYSLARAGAQTQPADRIKSFIGFPLDEMYPQFTSRPVEELKKYFQERAASTVVSSTQMLDGVAATLTRLHSEGFRLAIATTKIRPHAEGIVRKFQWERLFEATVGGNEVARVKPDPEPFLLALKRLGATAEHTVVVGDTVNDIKAAHAVPMRVIAVKSPYRDKEQLAGAEPNFFIESITDLPELIAKLNGSKE